MPTPLVEAVALTALNHMFKQGHFSMEIPGVKHTIEWKMQEAIMAEREKQQRKHHERQ